MLGAAATTRPRVHATPRSRRRLDGSSAMARNAVDRRHDPHVWLERAFFKPTTRSDPRCGLGFVANGGNTTDHRPAQRVVSFHRADDLLVGSVGRHCGGLPCQDAVADAETSVVGVARASGNRPLHHVLRLVWPGQSQVDDYSQLPHGLQHADGPRRGVVHYESSSLAARGMAVYQSMKPPRRGQASGVRANPLLRIRAFRR